MMSRQAYFYRVPPQELHRRNQLQADPAKTRALQTVIDMKVGLIADLESARGGNIIICYIECIAVIVFFFILFIMPAVENVFCKEI